jgi:hypothetical protein
MRLQGHTFMWRIRAGIRMSIQLCTERKHGRVWSTGVIYFLRRSADGVTTPSRVLRRKNGLYQHSDPVGWEKIEHVEERSLRGQSRVWHNEGLGKLTDECRTQSGPRGVSTEEINRGRKERVTSGPRGSAVTISARGLCCPQLCLLVH